MKASVSEFNAYRAKQNKRLLESDNLLIKRLYNLDSRAYEAGALSVPTKEMLGFAMSLVLRCDDCVKYHLEQAFLAKVSESEILEVLALAQLVGGTIVIPHARRAIEWWDFLNEPSTNSQA